MTTGTYSHIATVVACFLCFAGCTADRAMDFGPEGEISTLPDDQLSREILIEFAGHDFTLGENDKQAEVRLRAWEPGRRVILPYWLGINPVLPGFRRPTLGRIYVISEALMVRPLAPNEHLIRAGSTMFKSDAILKTVRTHYLDTGKMLPTVVRFVGTRTITVPRDAPQSGTVTIKAPVLKEVSLPAYIDRRLDGYAKYEVLSPA
ncbi:MAG: hypothetical protein ACREQB_03890 [Candidatus Binataceae bacterium]